MIHSKFHRLRPVLALGHKVCVGCRFDPHLRSSIFSFVRSGVEAKCGVEPELNDRGYEVGSQSNSDRRSSGS